MSKIIITKMMLKEKLCIVTALQEEGKIIQLHVYPVEKKEILGNIYVGKVDNIAANIHAAFVKIQDQRICYLPIEDLKEPVYTIPKKNSKICVGDELLVQITQEGIKTKAPSATTNLNFTGRYLVLTTEKQYLGLSSKLNKEQKSCLKNWLEPEVEPGFGIIVRTNAKDASKEDIFSELQFLKKRLNRVLKYAPGRTCYSLVDETLPGYLQEIRDAYSEGLTDILTDNAELHQSIHDYLTQYQSDDIDKLTLYTDKLLPLMKLYCLETAFANAMREKVWLQSGGSIIIQQTEACVVIDVNTGKYTGKKKTEETFRKINLEAAAEIAYQIRLRNLSGTILIDFINLTRQEHEEELLHVLQKHLRHDPVKAAVIDMTKLKIVEVTRKKIKKSLAEEFAVLSVHS